MVEKTSLSLFSRQCKHEVQILKALTKLSFQRITVLSLLVLSLTMGASCKMRTAGSLKEVTRPSAEVDIISLTCGDEIKSALKVRESQSWIPFFKNKNARDLERNQRYEEKYGIAAGATSVELMFLGVARTLQGIRDASRPNTSSQERVSFDEVVAVLERGAPVCHQAFTCNVDREDCLAKFPHVILAREIAEVSLKNPALSTLSEVSSRCTIGEEETKLYDQLSDMNLMCAEFLSAADASSQDFKKKLFGKKNKLEIEDFGLIPHIVTSTRLLFGGSDGQGGDQEVLRGMCLVHQREKERVSARMDRDRTMGVTQIFAQLGLSAAVAVSPLAAGLIVDDIIALAAAITPSAVVWLDAQEEARDSSSITADRDECLSESIANRRSYRESLMFNDFLGFTVSTAVSVSLTVGLLNTSKIWAQLIEKGAVTFEDNMILIHSGHQALRELPAVKELVGKLADTGSGGVKALPLPDPKQFESVVKAVFEDIKGPLGNLPRLKSVVNRLDDLGNKLAARYSKFFGKTGEYILASAEGDASKSLFELYVKGLSKLDGGVATLAKIAMNSGEKVTPKVAMDVGLRVMRDSLNRTLRQQATMVNVGEQTLRSVLVNPSVLDDLLIGLIDSNSFGKNLVKDSVFIVPKGMFEMAEAGLKRKNLRRVMYNPHELSDDELQELAKIIGEKEIELSKTLEKRMQELWQSNHAYRNRQN